MSQVKMLFVVSALLASAAFGGELEDLKKKNEELEKRIEKLEGAYETEEHEEHHDEHHEEHRRDLFHHDFGEVQATVNIHMVGLFAVGYSSVKDRFTERLQGGGHDPKRRGFNLQQLELAFSGALEPYFSLDAFAVFSLEGSNLKKPTFARLVCPLACNSKAA